MRIGQGLDVHKLVEGRKLILLGKEIPYEKGLLGHSDADVAAHALSDAILGAAGLYDIGKHFPDSDPAYEGISSMILLDDVIKKISDKGLYVVNADITIIAQRPKLAPYIDEMRKITAEHLLIDSEFVNVKATTTEQLGFEGRGEGITAMAICLLEMKGMNING